VNALRFKGTGLILSSLLHSSLLHFFLSYKPPHNLTVLLLLEYFCLKFIEMY